MPPWFIAYNKQRQIAVVNNRKGHTCGLIINQSDFRFHFHFTLTAAIIIKKIITIGAILTRMAYFATNIVLSLIDSLIKFDAVGTKFLLIRRHTCPV
jgi:hypothetical protein